MVFYNGKDGGLLEQLKKSGYSVVQINNEHQAFNLEGDRSNLIDIEVQKIIDSYNPLISVKTAKKKEILGDSNKFMSLAILDKYPRFEVDTWQNQKADAEAYFSDNNAITITLDALASQRGKPREETAIKILEKSGQFAAFSARYAGERQRLEDLIDSATTIEQLNNIRFIPI